MPKNIARKYLGLTLHASLAPPAHTGDVRAILDPANSRPAAFCDEAERTDYEGMRSQALKEDTSMSSMEIVTRFFSFPVFDADYRTAIVVVTGRRDICYRAEKQPGSVRAIGCAPPEVDSVAKILKKSPHGWKLVASEVISQT